MSANERNWTLLRSAEEWQAFQRHFVATHNLEAGQVVWGLGPAEYPCLCASTNLVTQVGLRVITAYVLAADARELLAAVASPQPDSAGVPQQHEFNRWITAMHMAVTYFLVETGICKEAQFEEKLLEMLESVDTYSRDQTAETMQRLGKTQMTALQCLMKPKG